MSKTSRIKPTKASLSMMRIAALLVAFAGAGMIVAAVSNGLFDGSGVFGIVWVIACAGIVGFSIFSAFNRKVITEGIVSIEQEGEPSSVAGDQSVEVRLKTLDGLKRQKLISEEEYRKQREKIIQSV